MVKHLPIISLLFTNFMSLFIEYSTQSIQSFIKATPNQYFLIKSEIQLFIFERIEHIINLTSHLAIHNCTNNYRHNNCYNNASKYHVCYTHTTLYIIFFQFSIKRWTTDIKRLCYKREITLVFIHCSTHNSFLCHFESFERFRTLILYTRRRTSSL